MSALVWGTVPTVIGDETWDLLVGTDLTYDVEEAAPLATTILGLLGRRGHGAFGLFALPRRCEFEPGYSRSEGGEVLPDYMLLFDLIAEDGAWLCEHVGEVSSEEAGTCENSISIWRVRANQ